MNKFCPVRKFQFNLATAFFPLLAEPDENGWKQAADTLQEPPLAQTRFSKG